MVAPTGTARTLGSALAILLLGLVCGLPAPFSAARAASRGDAPETGPVTQAAAAGSESSASSDTSAGAPDPVTAGPPAGIDDPFERYADQLEATWGEMVASLNKHAPLVYDGNNWVRDRTWDGNTGRE
ncbi:MAG: hypothetical protein PVI57_23960, partial [Gemmatimonadota bacterium]